MKELEKNNLLGKIAYEIAFIAYLEGVKKSSTNSGLTNSEVDTLEKEFQQKIWFKVQILSVNKINDETLFKMSDETLKLYFG